MPDPTRLARELAPPVFRTDLSRPGFALADLGLSLSPQEFRALLVGIARELSRVYGDEFGRPLALISASAFDQQVTTEPHLDGGPEESVLVLGYEPTRVGSRVTLIDYTRAAADRGLTPRQFLARFNPMVRRGPAELPEYAVEVGPWHESHYRVLVINNGSLPPERADHGMLGVLHQAVIVTHRPGESRHVNSLLLGTRGPEDAALTDEQVRAFVESATPATA